MWVSVRSNRRSSLAPVLELNSPAQSKQLRAMSCRGIPGVSGMYFEIFVILEVSRRTKLETHETPQSWHYAWGRHEWFGTLRDLTRSTVYFRGSLLESLNQSNQDSSLDLIQVLIKIQLGLWINLNQMNQTELTWLVDAFHYKHIHILTHTYFSYVYGVCCVLYTYWPILSVRVCLYVLCIWCTWVCRLYVELRSYAAFVRQSWVSYRGECFRLLIHHTHTLWILYLLCIWCTWVCRLYVELHFYAIFVWQSWF